MLYFTKIWLIVVVICVEIKMLIENGKHILQIELLELVHFVQNKHHPQVLISSLMKIVKIDTNCIWIIRYL